MSDEREKVDAAQFESGDGLPPVVMQYPTESIFDALQRIHIQLQSALAEIERLKGLLREIAAIPNSLSGGDWDDIEKARTIANSAFEDAVTGE